MVRIFCTLAWFFSMRFFWLFLCTSVQKQIRFTYTKTTKLFKLYNHAKVLETVLELSNLGLFGWAKSSFSEMCRIFTFQINTLDRTFWSVVQARELWVALFKSVNSFIKSASKFFLFKLPFKMDSIFKFMDSSNGRGW